MYRCATTNTDLYVVSTLGGKKEEGGNHPATYDFVVEKRRPNTTATVLNFSIQVTASQFALTEIEIYAIPEKCKPLFNDTKRQQRWTTQADW